MDVVERVARIAPDAGISAGDIAAARGRLLDGINAEVRAGRRRTGRRWMLTAGLVGAAGAVVAVVLVVAGLSAPAPNPPAEALPPREPGSPFTPAPTPEPTDAPDTAASVLTGAASTVGSDPGPVAGPGQYLQVVHHNTQLVLHSPEDPVNSTRAQATSGWVATNSYTSYIPGDPTGEWVDVFDPGLEVVELFGSDATARSEEWLAQFSWRTDPIVTRYRGDADAGAADAVPNQTFRHYAEMPRDPAALLAWVREYWSGMEPGTEDMGTVIFLMQELQLGLAPVDLRAAMFRALSLIPGGVITGESGDVVTLSFLTYPPDERWDSLSIDTRTALVTQVSTTFGSGGTVVPDGVPNATSTLTISVVDDAP